MVLAKPDYRLLWLRRLDALWLARPDPTSVWGVNGLAREMREALGEAAFDGDAAWEALTEAIRHGEILAIEVGEGELAARITATGQARLAVIEGRPV
ncbi:MAG TPA: hypothetical protein VEW25_13910 [Allosphingosinicella sp.]|nr:hypothetical protein [Allosphingosinicella sp.]